MGFGEEDQRDRWFPYIISGVHTVSVTSLLILTRAEAVFIGFPPLKLLFFSPFHTVLFGRKTLCTGYSYRVGSYAPDLEGRVSTEMIWNSSAREICVSFSFI